ncbi:MAG TPA: hypothetical protein VF001_01205 [Candidatus Limnocylindria bacterium]
MTTRSSTAGGRTLPGGRALLALSLALLASCASPATMFASPSAPTAVPSAADASGTVPTLGTKPPAGLVLPSYFVTVTSSSNGAIAVLTTPDSRCGLSVARPTGATADAGERVADTGGVAGWSYPPLAEHGVSILTVRCTLGDQSQTAKAEVLLP